MIVISLHAYLDRGGELEALPFLDILAESIVVDRRRKSDALRLEAASSFRRAAGTLLGDPARHELATLLLWEAEAYENEDVAARFESALPAHKLSQLLAGTEEARHPHRLLVGGLKGFTCGACGDEHDDATAVSIEGIDGLTYCSACIGLASLALGNHCGPAKIASEDAGREPLPPVASGRAPGPSPATAAGRRRSRARAQVAAALVVGVVTGTAGLASAGSLPPPLQSAAHDTLALMGITVPEPGDHRPGCPDKAAEASPGASSDSARPAVPAASCADSKPGNGGGATRGGRQARRAVLQAVPESGAVTVVDHLPPLAGKGAGDEAGLPPGVDVGAPRPSSDQPAPAGDGSSGAGGAAPPASTGSPGAGGAQPPAPSTGAPPPGPSAGGAPSVATSADAEPAGAGATPSPRPTTTPAPPAAPAGARPAGSTSTAPAPTTTTSTTSPSAMKQQQPPNEPAGRHGQVDPEHPDNGWPENPGAAEHPAKEDRADKAGGPPRRGTHPGTPD